MGKICLPCVGEGPPQALESISLVQTLALAVLAAVGFMWKGLLGRFVMSLTSRCLS